MMAGEKAPLPVCVVGGGPAGLAAAIALRMEDFPVIVADCAKPPIDKSCGEGLMPDTLAALKALGVEIPDRLGYALKGITFINKDQTITGTFSGNATARGVRRTSLHEILVRRASALGSELLWSARVDYVDEGTVVINGRKIRTSYVIGADGQTSRIRRQSGLSSMRHEQRRYGFRRHYNLPPWSNDVQLYWGERSQIYVTPVGEQEVGVALISRDPKLRLDEALLEFPEFQERLKDAKPSSAEKGSLTGSRVIRRIYRSSVALLGDASGSVDAITGEGMGLCFHQALALAKACKIGDLSQYDRAHRKIRQRPALMAGIMLLLARHAELRRRAFVCLQQRPELFDQLLAMHVGELPFSKLLSWPILPLGAAFLTA